MSLLLTDRLHYIFKKEVDNKRLIPFLRKNKLSLIELTEYEGSDFFKDFFNSSEFQKVLMGEIKIYEDWKNDFLIIKEKWDYEGVDYIFHKSSGQFPYMSDNLDVLVKTKDFGRAGEIIRNLGYVKLRNIQEAHKEFYRKFIGEKIVVPIHLHERICWSVPYEDIKHLWANYKISKDDDMVHYPCFEDCILINSAHCFLEDHEVKLYDLLTIKSCIQDKNIDWDYIFATAERMKWLLSLHTALLIFEHLHYKLFNAPLFPKEILAQARENVYPNKWIYNTLNKKIFVDSVIMPFKIPHVWTRLHTSLRVINDPTFGNKFKRYKQVFLGLLDGFIHLKLGIKSHPSFFITFSGLDGSGKTEHIKTLRNAFDTCDIETKYLWSRAGSLPIIHSALKVMRKIFSIKHKSVNSSNKSKSTYLPHNLITIKTWRLINTIEMGIFYFFNVKLPLLFGKVVIADRYIFDSIVDLENLNNNIKFNRILYRILKKITPSPDIAFFLKVNSEVIIKRLNNETIEELTKKSHLYNQLLKHEDFFIIENSDNFDNVSEKIVKVALSDFFKKYPEKFNGYTVCSLRYK